MGSQKLGVRITVEVPTIHMRDFFRIVTRSLGDGLLVPNSSTADAD